MKKLSARILAACLAVFLSACAAPGKDARLCRITFDRGHGTLWGNQFYIEICPEEIVLMRYFPAGSTEQTTKEHVPITAEEWASLSAAVRALPLKEDRPGFWSRLWKNRKLDGGEYRKLTLQWQSGNSVQTICYQWPAGQQAEALEQLLEAFCR